MVEEEEVDDEDESGEEEIVEEVEEEVGNFFYPPTSMMSFKTFPLEFPKSAQYVRTKPGSSIDFLAASGFTCSCKYKRAC